MSLLVARCAGCQSHGQCLDAQKLSDFEQPREYSGVSPTAAPRPAPNSIEFETVLQQLERQSNNAGSNKTEYEQKIKEVADFIIANVTANSPASMRAALQLHASNSFATWSEQTAEEELRWCSLETLETI